MYLYVSSYLDTSIHFYMDPPVAGLQPGGVPHRSSDLQQPLQHPPRALGVAGTERAPSFWTRGVGWWWWLLVGGFGGWVDVVGFVVVGLLFTHYKVYGCFWGLADGAKKSSRKVKLQLVARGDRCSPLASQIRLALQWLWSQIWVLRKLRVRCLRTSGW